MPAAAAPAEVPVVHVIDSHTEGEPTRVVVDGWPHVSGSTMAERRDVLRDHFDHIRRGVACEPRGHDAIVGALITSPTEPDSTCGVVFFNDVGYLGMCGHGLIGLIETLAFQRKLGAATARVDTPVGTVEATRSADGFVTIRNVPAVCDTLDLTVFVPGVGDVTGDVAWGGNWFYIVPWDLSHDKRPLLDVALRIRNAVQAVDPRIDHVELIGAPQRNDADSRNFVLCPGAAYDRSPCGTGTSAKLAVMHARGELEVGQRWRQESITGSLFTAWLDIVDGELLPHIQGRAFITGESHLRFDERDPFRWGIPG